MSKFIENNVLTELPKNLSDKDFKTLINYRETAYNKGYEDALRSIKINLDHFLKDVYAIEMIYEEVLPSGKPDIDRYEGESDCSKFIRENVLGYEEK